MFSFEADRKSLGVKSRIGRILDLTVPNYAEGTHFDRNEDRYNRTLPALLCDWEHRKPVAGSWLFVATRDISSNSVGVLLQQPFRAERVLLAFWLDDNVSPEPWFFL